jgi:hypothetical protein
MASTNPNPPQPPPQFKEWPAKVLPGNTPLPNVAPKSSSK